MRRLGHWSRPPGRGRGQAGLHKQMKLVMQADTVGGSVTLICARRLPNNYCKDL